MITSITVVSLGPGDPELLNRKTVRTVLNADNLILLTERHLSAGWIASQGKTYTTLDDLFESSEDFDGFHAAAASLLWSKACASSVVFAVPDASTDLTVRTLFRTKPDGGILEIVPGTGYQDAYLSASMGWLPDPDLRVVTATDLLSADYDPNVALLVLELDNALLAGQVKVFLSDLLDDGQEVVLLQGGSSVSAIPLYELDRRDSYDHQTAVLVPSSGLPERTRFVLQDLVRIMDILRSPEGCPWDREQTHRSLRPYLTEEAWECVASIDQEDMFHLSEELGDLLFQIIFHSSIGKSFDEFTLNDVISSICLKMIRRHPHVFTPCTAGESTASPPSWEKLKQEETGHSGVSESLEDVPPGLPSQKYAAKVLKKLSPLPAFNRSADRILAEIRSEADRLAKHTDPDPEQSLETLLLLCAELCFRENRDGELLLHHAAGRLGERIRETETSLKKEGKAIECLTFRELGVYLNHVEGEIE